jgi:Uma2 family endonuclease
MMTTAPNNYNTSVALPAKRTPGPKQGYWTYNDYAKLPDDGRRYEVMNGVLIMTPAPSGAHQDTVGRFYYYLLQQIEFAGLGKVRLAPFDVELTPKRVVQPDVLVILNPNLQNLTPSRLIGPPDLAIEIASPGTATYDRLSKYEAYELAGVSEYWLADPDERCVEVLILNHGKYESLGIFQGDDTLQSQVAPGIMTVAVKHFFA